MSRYWIIAALLVWPACYIGSDRAGMEQCPGNHENDSMVVWQDRAMDLAGTPGITGIGPHPSRNCISVGVEDSSYVGIAESHLRELGIPRDAVVIAHGEE